MECDSNFALSHKPVGFQPTFPKTHLGEITPSLFFSFPPLQTLFTAHLRTGKWSRISSAFLEHALNTVSEQIRCHIQLTMGNLTPKTCILEIFRAPRHTGLFTANSNTCIHINTILTSVCVYRDTSQTPWRDLGHKTID